MGREEKGHPSCEGKPSLQGTGSDCDQRECTDVHSGRSGGSFTCSTCGMCLCMCMTCVGGLWGCTACMCVFIECGVVCSMLLHALCALGDQWISCGINASLCA